MSKRQLRKRSAKLKEDIERYRNAAETYDALHAARIGSHLPSNEEEYKNAEHHYNICDDTKRRGAGEIKGGGVVLRPSGMAAHREFHDLYTREEEKKPTRKGISLHEAAKTANYTGPKMRAIAFDERFCILCMGEVKPNRAGCDGGNKFFPDCTCCSMVDITMLQHGIDSAGLVAGDVIRSIICPQCKIQITKMQKEEKQHGLRVMVDGRDMPSWVIKQKAIYERLEHNWQKILHNARIEPIEGAPGFRVQGVGGA